MFLIGAVGAAGGAALRMSVGRVSRAGGAGSGSSARDSREQQRRAATPQRGGAATDDAGDADTANDGGAAASARDGNGDDGGRGRATAAAAAADPQSGAASGDAPTAAAAVPPPPPAAPVLRASGPAPHLRGGALVVLRDARGQGVVISPTGHGDAFDLLPTCAASGLLRLRVADLQYALAEAVFLVEERGGGGGSGDSGLLAFRAIAAGGRPLVARPGRDAPHAVADCPASPADGGGAADVGPAALWRQTPAGITNVRTGKRLGLAVVELFAVSSEGLRAFEKTAGDRHSAALAQAAALQAQLDDARAALADQEAAAAREARRLRKAAERLQAELRRADEARATAVRESDAAQLAVLRLEERVGQLSSERQGSLRALSAAEARAQGLAQRLAGLDAAHAEERRRWEAEAAAALKAERAAHARQLAAARASLAELREGVAAREREDALEVRGGERAEWTRGEGGGVKGASVSGLIQTPFSLGPSPFPTLQDAARASLEAELAERDDGLAGIAAVNSRLDAALAEIHRRLGASQEGERAPAGGGSDGDGDEPREPRAAAVGAGGAGGRPGERVRLWNLMQTVGGGASSGRAVAAAAFGRASDAAEAGAEGAPPLSAEGSGHSLDVQPQPQPQPRRSPAKGGAHTAAAAAVQAPGADQRLGRNVHHAPANGGTRSAAPAVAAGGVKSAAAAALARSRGDVRSTRDSAAAANAAGGGAADAGGCVLLHPRVGSMTGAGAARAGGSGASSSPNGSLSMRALGSGSVGRLSAEELGRGGGGGGDGGHRYSASRGGDDSDSSDGDAGTGGGGGGGAAGGGGNGRGYDWGRQSRQHEQLLRRLEQLERQQQQQQQAAAPAPPPPRPASRQQRRAPGSSTHLSPVKEQRGSPLRHNGGGARALNDAAARGAAFRMSDAIAALETADDAGALVSMLADPLVATQLMHHE